MAKADAHSESGSVFDELERTGQLGRDGHEADVAARRLPETVEERNRGRLQQLGRMHAAFGMRDERTFEVNAERHGAFD